MTRRWWHPNRPGEDVQRSDRQRWNTRYRAHAPAFVPNPLVAEVVAAGTGDGPALELACGRSGSALALAASGLRVVAVDVSEVALRQLRDEARRRALAPALNCVQADLTSFVPAPGRCSLVLVTNYWDADVFRAACAAVTPGGLLAWEALSASGPGEPGRWRVRHGDLSAALGPNWNVLSELFVHRSESDERGTTRLLARKSEEISGESPMR